MRNVPVAAILCLINLWNAPAFGKGASGCPAASSASAASSAPAASGSVVAPTTMHKVDVTNQQFRDLYAGAKARLLPSGMPVLLLVRDEVILVQGDKRTSRKYIADEYNILKTVDHVALGTYVALVGVNGAVGSDTIEGLKALRDKAKVMEAALERSSLAAEASKRQQQIIDTSVAYLDKVIGSGTADANETEAFAKSLGEAVMLNVNEAAAMEMAELDAQVRDLRKLVNRADWSKLHVVVAGSHMARDQERAMQYFERLLGVDREGGRLVYMEGSDEEDRALDLLATHLLDARIGKAFFNDEWRMHRDLLSDGARDYLKKHPPER